MKPCLLCTFNLHCSCRSIRMLSPNWKLVQVLACPPGRCSCSGSGKWQDLKGWNLLSEKGFTYRQVCPVAIEAQLLKC